VCRGDLPPSVEEEKKEEEAEEEAKEEASALRAKLGGGLGGGSLLLFIIMGFLCVSQIYSK